MKPTSENDGFPERLKRLRLSMELTMRQMALEFRVCHGAIHHWESGIRAIPGPVKKLIELYEERTHQQLGSVRYA